MQEISESQPCAQGDHIPWGWVALTAVALEIALVLSAVAWVAIYSYLIDPGHDLPYYQKHAEFASPIVSVVVGIPYLFFAGRWVGRKAGTRAVAACLWVWFILFIIDVLLILLGGATAYIWAMASISHVTKMLAAYLGGRTASRDVLRIQRAGV
jgi:hypothetical protein